MLIVQTLVLVFVAAGATAIVFPREPSRQAMVASFYGLLLTLLFIVFQSPDVALSELTVGTAAVPLMILLALSKTANYQRRRSREVDKP